MKPITAWAIRAPNGNVLASSTRTIKADCEHEYQLGTSLTWRQWERKGYRAVRVRIEEIEEGNDGPQRLAYLLSILFKP